jgi:hypothetical protein
LHLNELWTIGADVIILAVFKIGSVMSIFILLLSGLPR